MALKTDPRIPHLRHRITGPRGNPAIRRCPDDCRFRRDVFIGGSLRRAGTLIPPPIWKNPKKTQLLIMAGFITPPKDKTKAGWMAGH